MRMICARFAGAMAAALFAVTVSHTADAFELTPLPTKSERFRAEKSYGVKFRLTFPAIEFALHSFSSPAHEALTQAAYDCDAAITNCTDIDLDFANSGVIAGVRWNDDPPFQFGPGQGRYSGCPKSSDRIATVSFALRTSCWYNHFKDISAKADAKPDTFITGKGTMLARTHFGDLQFLHSMATSLGTSPQETKAKIMMWAEFTWRVQSGAADSIGADIKTGLINVNGFRDHFPTNEERTVTDLFTIGRPWLRHQLSDIAFGSLLHMVEDSYAGGHTKRRVSVIDSCTSSEIVAFHTYAGQDKTNHKAHDTLDRAQTKLELIEVLRRLVKLRDEKQSWQSVQPYLDNCVYKLAVDAVPATTEVDD